MLSRWSLEQPAHLVGVLQVVEATADVDELGLDEPVELEQRGAPAQLRVDQNLVAAALTAVVALEQSLQ